MFPSLQVVDPRRLFRSASAFNQDISSWNTHKFTSMATMFELAIAFNSPLDTWVRNSDILSSMWMNSEAILTKPYTNKMMNTLFRTLGMFYPWVSLLMVQPHSTNHWATGRPSDSFPLPFLLELSSLLLVLHSFCSLFVYFVLIH